LRSQGSTVEKTLLTSLEGDRRTSLKEEDVEGLLVLGNRADAQKAVVVAKDEKVLEILDPESYKLPSRLGQEAWQ